MDMVTVIDVLVVHHCGSNSGEAVGAAHEVEESLFKLFGEAIDDTVGILAKDLHLALVGLAEAVTLEAVLIAALLLTHLAVPAELLQTLGLDAIGDRLRGQEIVLPHIGY
jgi:hypothetical protein